jgi:hypothetical protein
MYSFVLDPFAYLFPLQRGDRKEAAGEAQPSSTSRAVWRKSLSLLVRQYRFNFVASMMMAGAIDGVV